MSDLGGVEVLGARILQDYVCNHGLSDAGDEVADVFVAGERRQGVEIGAVGCGVSLGAAFAFCEFRFMDADPGVYAAGDGGVCGGGEG